MMLSDGCRKVRPVNTYVTPGLARQFSGTKDLQKGVMQSPFSNTTHQNATEAVRSSPFSEPSVLGVLDQPYTCVLEGLQIGSFVNMEKCDLVSLELVRLARENAF